MTRSCTPQIAFSLVLAQFFFLGSVSCRQSSARTGKKTAAESALPSPPDTQATPAPRGVREDGRYVSLVASARKAAREGRYTETISLLDQAAAFVREQSSGQQVEEFCNEYSSEVSRLLDGGPTAADVPALTAYLTELDSRSCFATSEGQASPLFARIRAEMWRFAPAADTMRRIHEIVLYCTVFENTAGRLPNADELRTFPDAYEPTRLPNAAKLQRLTYDAWGTPFMIVYREGSYPQIVSAGADRTFSPEQWKLSGTDLPLDQDALGEGGRCCRRTWKLEADWINLLIP